MRLLGNAFPEIRPVIRRQRIAVDLDPVAAVEPRNALHQVRSRVVAEVRRDVANAQHGALLSFGKLVRLFMQHGNLKETFVSKKNSWLRFEAN